MSVKSEGNVDEDITQTYDTLLIRLPSLVVGAFVLICA